MPERRPGLIRFEITFYDNFCTLGKFRSRLSGVKSFGFGFQKDRNNSYEFDELTRIIREKEFRYGSKVGLFMKNNQTGRQEDFAITIPAKHPEAGADKVIKDDGYEIDITELLER